MNSYVSIYIPRMSTVWTQDGVKEIMRKYGIGTVTRIDFTPINKKPGFGEDVDSVVMSAFIHFMDPVLCADGNYYWMTGAPLGQFWNTIAAGEPYKLQITRDEYWICLKNKNPVKNTLMNIHQVVENGRHLESLVTAQAEEIKNLKETIDGLSKKLEGVHRVVFQIVGGIFCQRTQKELMNLHLYHLGFEQYKNAHIEKDTHPSEHWPTTRQGDKNSKRIQKLEEKVKSLEKDLSTYGVL
jgi:diadenosine tetraphosphate (Ap4A) HIT family hydrolase